MGADQKRVAANCANEHESTLKNMIRVDSRLVFFADSVSKNACKPAGAPAGLLPP
jgi:hypothetical protein